MLCVALYKGETYIDLGLDDKWDWKFEYEEFIRIKKYNLLTRIRDPNTVQQYSETCHIDLDTEYKRILSDEKFKRYAPIARIAYGLRNEKEYKENKIKNETSLKKAKGKGICTVTYVYLPESPNDEAMDVIRSFCDTYTKEELKSFGAFIGTTF